MDDDDFDVELEDDTDDNAGEHTGHCADCGALYFLMDGVAFSAAAGGGLCGSCCTEFWDE
jgi:hypothetical protein